MSHEGHTHGPGESHSHSHSPQQQQQQMVAPPPDPAMQALIDSSFTPVDATLVDGRTAVHCGAHNLEKCDDCDVDYVNLNRLSKLLAQNPNLLCPPPANVVTQKLSQIVAQTKEEGNTLFKMGKHAQAIGRYNQAASFAVQRPPWETNQLMREELSTVVSNRSAALYEAGDYIGALVDAETVVQVRRNWSKGHFRRAKAMLALGAYDEAKEAVKLGLSFEPTNSELNNFLAEIERKDKDRKSDELVSIKKEEPSLVSASA
ncbi:hypothetical protein HGRIS_004127 [Hohenbuehelia grisea]|uniref:Translocation protein sec72 n=1 Tax=Hohenbuehelia grisea TaxID=104357 RepID=A0ABR3JJA4_9AGAR